MGWKIPNHAAEVDRIKGSIASALSSKEHSVVYPLTTHALDWGLVECARDFVYDRDWMQEMYFDYRSGFRSLAWIMLLNFSIHLDIH